MGNLLPLKKGTPGSLVQLQVLVRHDTRDRVDAAARRIDQPRSAWLRLAIIEKLERDTRA